MAGLIEIADDDLITDEDSSGWLRGRSKRRAVPRLLPIQLRPYQVEA
jgi:hypothetical protein